MPSHLHAILKPESGTIGDIVRHEHSIWQDIQAKNIYSPKFLFQKLEYIHNNPVAKDWQLVQDRADYQYSSACLYDYERTPVIEVTNVYDWLSQN